MLTSVVADFDADGFADLAVGVPLEDIGGFRDAGAVNVIYGSARGLSTRNQFWHENRAGVPDASETNDQFGFALAAGDFNDDGFADLAVGVPGEDNSRGAVVVIYGSPVGLSATAGLLPQNIRQGVNGVDGVQAGGDRFGAALAAGHFNFDRDSFADLAIGSPGDGFGSSNAGAVNVLYGSAAGPQTTAPLDQIWTQNSASIEGSSSSGDEFGFALVTGDFDGNGNADLAIGVPGEGSASGAVNVIYSNGAGLSATSPDDQLWAQGALLGSGESGDRFGHSLAAGDFNGNGFTDLAVGAPLENIGSIADAGAVNIIYGSASRLTTTGNQFWNQSGDLSPADIQDVSEAGDRFGFSLAAGDFNDTGFADLAIGVPLEDLTGGADAGAVSVLYGVASSGLSASGNQFWHQDISGIRGTSVANDQFGSAVAAGDFNGDGASDMAVGVPGDNVGSINDAGAVNAIYGSSASGLITSGEQLWNQQNLGQGVAERDDRFGAALASGQAQGLVAPRGARSTNAVASLASSPAAQSIEQVVTGQAPLDIALGFNVFQDRIDSAVDALFGPQRKTRKNLRIG